MLHIRYDTITYDQHQTLPPGEVFLCRNEPLKICGNAQAVMALFQTLQNKQVVFMQRDNTLDKDAVQQAVTLLTPYQKNSGFKRICDLLDGNETMQEQIVLRLQIHASIHDRIHKLSQDDQQLLYVYAALHAHANFLILIAGNWNLYSMSLLTKMRALLKAQYENGCYVMMAQDCDKLLDSRETWNIGTTFPIKKEHYLEEDVLVSRQCAIPCQTISPIRWIAYGIALFAYCLFTALFASLIIQYHHLFDVYLSPQQQELSRWEDHQQYYTEILLYPQETFANFVDDFYFASDAMLADEQLNQLRAFRDDVRIYPQIYAPLHLYNSLETYWIKNGKREKLQMKDNQKLSYVQMCTYQKADTALYHGIPEHADHSGVTISSELYEILGKDALGKTLYTAAEIPVYMREMPPVPSPGIDLKNDENANGFTYETLREVIDVTLPIAQVSDRTLFNGCDVWMEESVFFDYQKKAREKSIYRHGISDIYEYQSSNYLLVSTHLPSLSSLEAAIQTNPSWRMRVTSSYAIKQNMINEYQSFHSQFGKDLLPTFSFLGVCMILSGIVYVRIKRMMQSKPWWTGKCTVVHVLLLGGLVFGICVGLSILPQALMGLDGSFPIYPQSFNLAQDFMRQQLYRMCLLFGCSYTSTVIVWEYALMATIAALFPWWKTIVSQIVHWRKDRRSVYVSMPEM